MERFDIYMVLAASLVVWLSLFAYMVRLDRHVSQAEERAGDGAGAGRGE